MSLNNTTISWIIIVIVLVLLLLVISRNSEYSSSNNMMENMTDTPFKIPSLNVPNLNVTGSFNILPRGSIIMWAGPSNNIPQGWVICDGNSVLSDGTVSPNLVDYFVVGGKQHATGLPSITASGKTSTDGAHSHSTKSPTYDTFLTDWYTGGLCNIVKKTGYSATPSASTPGVANSAVITDVKGEHTHNLLLDSSVQRTTVNTLTPDWVSLIFIIRV